MKDDVDTLKAALSAGASARNITSPWDGTALIAAAHLGHDGVVRELIRAGALVEAGASVKIADRQGRTPRMLAIERGYGEMVSILERAEAR